MVSRVCTRALAGLAFVVSMLAATVAAQADRPDAVVVAEPDPRVFFELLPLLARFDHAPVIVHAPDNEPYIAEYLNQIGAKRTWLVDAGRRRPDAWWRNFDAVRDTAAVINLADVRAGWNEAAAVVLLDGRSSELALPACLLATARQVPAVWLDGPPDAALRDWLRRLAPSEIICAGFESPPLAEADFPDVKFVSLETVPQILKWYEASLGEPPVEHLVVLSARPPPDRALAHINWLAVSYAVQRRAAVAILQEVTNLEGQIERLAATTYPAVKYMTLWGNGSMLPDVELDDPVAAAGLETRLTEPKIAVPPLTGLARREPCQFRVGRITGDSVSSVSLLVARNLRRPELHAGKAPQALILANADYELPLLEAITRTTDQSFERAGWSTRALYGWRTSWYKRPLRLWGADLVLYEGHTANLARSVQFDHEREPVYPGLYIFQGCKTLRQPEVIALLRNGAAGVIGTSTNTYSASGGALAKTYVDAMLLDGADAGTSLMIARNFMLALADLKDRRGHEQSPKILRGGLTFALWGDPTWRPPPSPATVPDSERVHTTRRGNVIEMHVPEQFAAAVESGDYVAQIPVGAKLAGMYEWENEERTRRQLPPLFFVVVPLADYAGAAPPAVTSPVARNRWTSLWDPRNRWLYLLVQSSGKLEFDQGKKLTFRVGLP